MKNTDSLSDEIKQERKKALEGKSFGYKAKYYIYYYKWYAIGIVAAALLLFSLINTIRNNKEVVLGVAVVNGVFEADYEGFKNDFVSHIGLNEKQDVDIDSGYTISAGEQNSFDLQSMQKIFVRMAAGQLDIIIAPEDIFSYFADIGYMTDLRNVLPQEEIDKYDVLIGHVPDDSVEAVDNANASRHDELSGINIADFPKIKESGFFDNTDGPVYFGFVADGHNVANSIAFLEYIEQ